MISSCLSRQKTVGDFWPFGISSHGKKIWFMEVSANGHGILEKLSHKPWTPNMRRRKNKFVSQRPSIFTIMSVIYSSILESLIKFRPQCMLVCSGPVEFPLFTVCPCINNKLLEQLFTIKERWLRTISDV